MQVTAITGEHNPLLKKVRSLHLRSARKKSRLFLIESAKVLEEALLHNIVIQNVFVSKSFLSQGLGSAHHLNLDSINVVDDGLFESLVTTEAPTGIIAIAEMPNFDQKDLFGKSRHVAPLVVIADAIQDPGNLGTMIRTAMAARATGMILTKGTVDLFNSKVVRAAAGALFSLPIISDLSAQEALEIIRQHGLNLVACDAQASKYFWDVDLKKPTAFIVGNEGQGIQSFMLEHADETVQIPMHEQSESLNVAVSTAIVLFSAVQQRLFGISS